MDKVYEHTKVEEKLYREWEEKGYFKPEVNPKGEPYSIILPPPNANAPLHFGHAMYVIEDILVRYHRMKGSKTLWVPGADHAGFETQFVYEKRLAEEGKSRFDFPRDVLFKNIWDYVEKNRGGMESQLRKLGFSLDWSRAKFTMDKEIVKIVYKNFKRLYDDGLVYRDKRLVNFCTFDGTSFSDLEVIDEETIGKLYEISYPVKDGGEIIVATTRPETMFGDMAVMVSSNDKRYKNLIGKFAIIPLINREIPIISDDYVDKDFGTGAVKVTPFHDFNDWEVSKRHGLNGIQIIGFDGKMQNTNIVDGLYVKQARKKTLELLEENGILRNTKEYKTVKKVCYKCKNVLEPLPLEQWFVKMEPLAKSAIKAVKNGEIKIHPKSFEKIYFQFLENIHDWNISRQTVWGIQIPAFYCKKCSNWTVTDYLPVEKCTNCHSKNLVQDTDTFDTWFSSSQWPFATLMTGREKDYETFYPTTVMETGYDILRWWVARMVMMGLYATGKSPFKNIVLHGLVNDPLGKKMSKSKGNVVNPLELVEEYGADAVRFALVYETALGNDQALSYPKLEAARRFTNKLWNIGRFIEFQKVKIEGQKSRIIEVEESKKGIKRDVISSAYPLVKSIAKQYEGHGVTLAKLIEKGSEAVEQAFENFNEGSEYKFETFAVYFVRKRIIEEIGGVRKIAEIKEDKDWIKKIVILQEEVSKNLDNYQFNQVSEKLYEFIWHEFADKYIEDVKNRITPHSYAVLFELFIVQLKLLHPIMPFVTDEIYQRLTSSNESLMIQKWPEV